MYFAHFFIFVPSVTFLENSLVDLTTQKLMKNSLLSRLNLKALSLEERYLNFYNLVVKKITSFGEFLYKFRVKYIKFIIPCILFLLGIDSRQYGIALHLIFIAALYTFTLYATYQFKKAGFLRPVSKRVLISAVFSFCTETLASCTLFNLPIQRVKLYSYCMLGAVPFTVDTFIPNS